MSTATGRRSDHRPDVTEIKTLPLLLLLGHTTPCLKTDKASPAVMLYASAKTYQLWVPNLREIPL